MPILLKEKEYKIKKAEKVSKIFEIPKNNEIRVAALGVENMPVFFKNEKE